METKQDIRRKILCRRKELSTKAWRENSRKITERVIAHPAFERAKSIYGYLPVRNEVDTSDILLAAWKQGKKVAVPKVLSKTEMQFFYIESFADLKPGSYGIPEPVTARLAEDSAALVILPGVAFDRFCGRIGYGGGYYDRYLEAHGACDTMALAFSMQCVPKVEMEEHDIRPRYLVTECGDFCRDVE